MPKIALLVGVDDYPMSPLSGCVNDADRMHDLLARHANGDPNFECRRLIAPVNGGQPVVTRESLQAAVEDLFQRESQVAVLYFAGHGTANNLGGYLVTQDAKRYNQGVSMNDVLTMANKSPARQKVIILDCCHSGALGQLPAVDNDAAILKAGISILSACRESETAAEKSGNGVFTSLVCDALIGGAADVCGKVTLAGIYAYVDEALGGFEQRPLFKNHVSKLFPLRICKPAVDLEILRLLPKYFKTPAAELPLDSSYEPTAQPRHAEHELTFGHLQKLRDARLLVPVGEEHLYYAAMNGKSCRLTGLGRFYWHLSNSGKI